MWHVSSWSGTNNSPYSIQYTHTITTWPFVGNADCANSMYTLTTITNNGEEEEEEEEEEEGGGRKELKMFHIEGGKLGPPPPKNLM